MGTCDLKIVATIVLTFRGQSTIDPRLVADQSKASIREATPSTPLDILSSLGH